MTRKKKKGWMFSPKVSSFSSIQRWDSSIPEREQPKWLFRSRLSFSNEVAQTPRGITIQLNRRDLTSRRPGNIRELMWTHLRPRHAVGAQSNRWKWTHLPLQVQAMCTSALVMKVSWLLIGWWTVPLNCRRIRRANLTPTPPKKNWIQDFRARRQRLSGVREKLFPDLEMVHNWRESYATSGNAKEQQGSEPGAQLNFDLGNMKGRGSAENTGCCCVLLSRGSPLGQAIGTRKSPSSPVPMPGTPESHHFQVSKGAHSE